MHAPCDAGCAREARLASPTRDGDVGALRVRVRSPWIRLSAPPTSPPRPRAPQGRKPPHPGTCLLQGQLAESVCAASGPHRLCAPDRGRARAIWRRVLTEPGDGLPCSLLCWFLVSLVHPRGLSFLEARSASSWLTARATAGRCTARRANQLPRTYAKCARSRGATGRAACSSPPTAPRWGANSTCRNPGPRAEQQNAAGCMLSGACKERALLFSPALSVVRASAGAGSVQRARRHGRGARTG